ncbi:Protein CBG16459 [Caenorhabditis briggsae]|uniref:Protein CBG16459 n=2 Tax=Caenorhabditis briggsae TaxID=6238 RepID=A8XP43_CAEBR|nr:Protein CBG16459 [Caenorhabditis briggsae]ULT97516.1 hypothetical protein L3Y34_005376 [Caenorhabditis briggsae]CAP34419.2 Protein CBG16459 [Caenorhabditis briggsae]
MFSPLLLLLFLLAPDVSAQYDTFSLNMSFLCGHSRQYTYEITFNIRDEDPDRSIRDGAIVTDSGAANIGITSVSLSGFYEREQARAPMWEPVVEFRHTCQADQKGYNRIVLSLPPSPALRNKTRYMYRYFMDITDKKGSIVADAEVIAQPPK